MNLLTKAFKRLLLTQIATAALDEDGVLVGAKIALFTNGELLSDETAYADLVQPTFTGYAVSAAVTYGAPVELDDGSVILGGDLKQFLCTGGTPDEEITGVVIFTGTGGNEVVLWTEKFATTVRITGADEGCRYAPNLKLGDDGDYGSGLLLA